LRANNWGLWLDECQGQNIRGLEPLGSHKVGTYGLTGPQCIYMSCSSSCNLWFAVLRALLAEKSRHGYNFCNRHHNRQ